MKQSYKLLIVSLSAAFLAGCGGINDGLSSPASQSVSGGAAVGSANHFVPRYITVKPRGVNYATLRAQADAGQTIPFFSAQIKSDLDGKEYSFSMVGKNPVQHPDAETVLPFVPIVLVMNFPEGPLDPTQPACHDTVSVQDRFFKGPDFENTQLNSNGVDLGTVELDDAFQRAEFWKVLKLFSHENYHVVLKPAASPIVVRLDAPAGSYTMPGVCPGNNHRVGVVEWKAYDELIKDLAETYAKPTEIPLVLTYNVVTLSAGCPCVLGWHSAFTRKDGLGTQVYGAAVYNDRGIFYDYPDVEDIHAWTHEIGEIFNNPFLTNVTPAWGHTGQVFGCQADLEVGDPLTFDSFELTHNGFHYHPQELAFFDWFYRAPSIGTGALYSFKGTFTSTQGVCR